jgi:hypothetical protein
VCEIQDRVYVEMDDSVNGVTFVMVLQCRVASRKCFDMSIWAGTFGANSSGLCRGLCKGSCVGCMSITPLRSGPVLGLHYAADICS